MQGKKTHEQKLRTLERKPDIPDARANIHEAGKASVVRMPKRRSDRANFP
jgi:hypothetical protein